MKKPSRAGGKRAKARPQGALKPRGRNAPKPQSNRRSAADDSESEVAQLKRELREAVEQQTATAEILRVISSSPGDLQPVFEAILENATRICEAKFGTLYLSENDGFRVAAMHNAPPAYEEARVGLVHPPPDTSLWRAAKTKQVAQTADVMLERGYIERDPFVVSAVAHGGYRGVLGVPMLQEDKLIGVICIFRQEVRPFTDKQIELVQNFAAQAVIAIENARLLNELRESLQQQTATSEVLQVISSSPGDLQPVFDTILANATQICAAKFGVLWLSQGEPFRCVALHNAPPAFADHYRTQPTIHPVSGTGLRRLLETREVTQVTDMTTIQPYIERDPFVVRSVELGGYRSVVNVPMLKESELIGAISIYHQEIRPFTDKQIELVQNFAAQAVIAIENARLLSELRDSLQEQTATSEVLQVISGSPADLQPVFATMLEKAVRICDANFGNIFRWHDDALHLVAPYNIPPAFAEFRKRAPFRPDAENPIGRMVETKTVVHVADLAAESRYKERLDQGMVAAVELGSVRTFVAVPMLRESELIGALIVYRQEVRPFTDRQIALVTNFAAQAVIAIENARLLSELRQRTTDLTESLEQQTATSEVLQVISSSPGDLKPVFEAMLEKAVHVCDATFGNAYRWDGETSSLVASNNTPPAYVEFRKRSPIFKDGSAAGRMLATKTVVHIRDVAASQLYLDRNPAQVAGVELGGMRTFLAVPMLKEDELIGALALSRQEVKPFTEKQIALVQNFAAQAVIAIENARLFEAEQQRTRELARSLEDLRTAQDRLVQTEKLASLGQLTAGIAHEIKNPLNFVNNFSAVSVELIGELREALGGAHLDSKLRAEIAEIADMLQGNLDKVVQHGKRANSIVKNMLLHSRQGSGEHRPVDINALVEESLNLAYHGARAENQGFNITLERSFDPTAGEVDLFPQEITRVLLNLISNGFYAATKRKAEANGGDYEPTLAAATKNLGDRVEIRIRDNGTGIPPEVKEKLFSPFFTTKPAGEGTGLGLSISHDIIVKQHGGSIEVDTQPGAFTEFRIVLPRAGASLIKSGKHA